MEDDAIIQIISRLGVDYSQAITSAEQFAAKLNRVNTTLERVQATSKITAATLAATFTGAGAITAATQQAAATGKVTTANKILADSYMTATDVAKDHIRTAKDLGKEYDVMGSQLSRHISWFASGALIFGSLELMKEGLVDVEKGMKGLQTVLPELAHDQVAYNDASREAIDLLQRYGANIDEVMQSARSFGRMYKDVDTVMGLTNDAILLNVIDTVGLEDAVKGNEAALSVYGEELKSTNEVLAFSGKLMDSLTRLSHESMAQASDLIQILQQSAGAAKNAKVEMDQLLGLGASAVRATGLQGQGGNLGRMLRTVFSQLSAPTQAVEEDIEKIGVKMRDTTGELRSAYDLILDLSLATKDASISQEDLNNAIMKAASGKFQYSKLSALVGQFDEIVINTARSINSQGMTMKMAAQQMDTIERKARMLKGTLIDMFSGAGDNGLREELKGMIDGINQFLMGMNQVSAPMINWGLRILGVVVAFKTLTATYNALLPATALATLMTDGLTFAQARQSIAAHGAAGALAVERAALIAETAAATGATTATNAFNASLIRNPVGLVITAITLLAGVVLTKYISKLGEAEKATMDLNQAQQNGLQFAQQQAMQMNTSIDYLISLKEKHSQLAQAINGGKLSIAELAEAQKNLNAVDEAVLILADGKTRALIKANGVTEAEIQLVVDSAIKSKQAAISKIKDQKEMADKAVAETERRIKALEAENNLWLKMSKKNPAKPSFLNALPDNGKARGPSGFENTLDTENKKLDEQKQKATELAHAIIVAQGEIAQLKHSSDSLSDDSSFGNSSNGLNARSNWVETLLDSTLALAEAQGNLNAVTQRGIDTQEALDKLMVENAMTSKEYSDGLGKRTAMDAMLEEKQKGLHKEADLYREAIVQLEAKQKTINNTTEEGKEAYKKIGDEIENARQKIDELGLSWLQLEERQRQLPNEQYQSYKAELEHLKKVGELTANQEMQLLAQKDISTFTLAERRAEEEEYYSQIISDMTSSLNSQRNTEQSNMESRHKQILAYLEEEKQSSKDASDARIQAIQDELDALERSWEEQDTRDRIEELQNDLNEIQSDTQVIYQNGVRRVLYDQEGYNAKAKNLEEAKRDEARRIQKQELQDRIDAARTAQQTEQDSYDKQIKIQSDALDVEKAEFDSYWETVLDSEQINQNAILLIKQLGYAKALEMAKKFNEEEAALLARSAASYPGPASYGNSSGYESGVTYSTGNDLTSDDSRSWTSTPGGNITYWHEGGVVAKAHGGWAVPGGLAADEVPAILQTREMVLPRDIADSIQFMSRTVAPMLQGGNGSPVTSKNDYHFSFPNMVVMANNPEEFANDKAIRSALARRMG